MSVGFRKSLFGFNCDDVINYIEESHKRFSTKEKELNKKINSLDETISDVNAQLNAIKIAKAEVEAQLKEYTDKQDEIERLSQNIGRLYLVSQANAKAIMKNSAENSEIASLEVEKNLNSIDNAHEQLANLKGSDAHFSVIISDGDEKTLKRLGINVSCEAKYENKCLYHK